ncbi:phage protein Gp36 family protein [Kingella kingae]|uniref:phage protein Gp36 family protein n=1 Tax=Kingella kingae TaxID=504 RepID=UPI001E367DD7
MRAVVHYRLTATSGTLVTDEIRNRYKIDVLDLLKALAAREVQLGSDSQGEKMAISDNGVAFVNGKTRIFSC